jgi:transmembrane sensor
MTGGYSTSDPRISEEAAEWFVEFRTGTLDERARQRFDAWVRTSPEHLRAYLECAAIWEEGSRLDTQGQFDAATLLSRVHSEGNVVPLATGAMSSAEHQPSKRPSRLLAGLAACLAVVALAIGGWLWLDGRTTYATGVGEQRSLTLADGSIVELNARSEIEVRLSDTERRVELVAGQALFQVAKDPQRPFIVRSGAASVRAVGTQFDVYRRPEDTIVTVLEGRVAVSSAQDVAAARAATAPEQPQSLPPGLLEKGTHPLLLSAGEQATVARTGAVKKRAHASLRAATAWVQRQLIFESATLKEIAQELNRYSPRSVVVDPSAPADLRLSGVFSTANIDFLIHFLQQRPGIRVDETGDSIVIRGASAPPRQ